MPRSSLIFGLALSLLGCATASAPPGANGGIARLPPDALARALPKPEAKLAPAELVRMSKEGIAAKDIVARIKETGSHYALGAAQLIELHQQGVSTEVLDYIQSAHEQDLNDRWADEINQREQRHAEELRREQELRRSELYCDPWWPGHPGLGWNYGRPFQPYGGFYWRR